MLSAGRRQRVLGPSRRASPGPRAGGEPRSCGASAPLRRGTERAEGRPPCTPIGPAAPGPLLLLPPGCLPPRHGRETSACSRGPGRCLVGTRVRAVPRTGRTGAREGPGLGSVLADRSPEGVAGEARTRFHARLAPWLPQGTGRSRGTGVLRGRAHGRAGTLGCNSWLHPVNEIALDLLGGTIRSPRLRFLIGACELLLCGVASEGVELCLFNKSGASRTEQGKSRHLAGMASRASLLGNEVVCSQSEEAPAPGREAGCAPPGKSRPEGLHSLVERERPDTPSAARQAQGTALQVVPRGRRSITFSIWL